LKEIYPQFKNLGTAIIVSVAAREESEFCALANRLEAQSSIKAVELNLSCPNVKGNIISQYPEEIYKVVKAFRSRFSRTLIVKLTPEVTDINQTAFQAQEAGADALNIVNTFLGIKFDLKTQKPVLGNVTGGYSGRGIKPMALYRVWKVCSKITLPVIGGGGIHGWEDAAEFFIAGASAVSVGTANFIRPNTVEMVVRGLYAYMRENKIKKLGKLEIIR
jgi:dihydroorotate dehydrogenase (NAD+) catalytic subunit